MNILVSGATGFIGKNLVKSLLGGVHSVLAIYNKSKNKNNKNIKFIKIDFNKNLSNSQKKKIFNFKPDIFVHLAWSGIPDFSHKVSQDNFLSSKIFINYLIKEIKIKKIIITGSCFEKKNSLMGNSFFSVYKKKLYKYVQNISKKNKVSFLWFRLFYVYGRYQRRDSLIPYLINAISSNKSISILKPDHSNDYIHVSDVVNLIIKSLNKKSTSGIFDVGSGKLTNTRFISEQLLKNYKYKKKIQYKNLGKKNLSLKANIEKTYNFFKWKPKFYITKHITTLLKEKKL